MYSHDDSAELWHVVFEKSNHKHWIFRWIDKDYQHCWCAKQSPGKQYWIIVNGKHSHLDVSMYPIELAPTMRELAPDATSIITIKMRYNVLNAIHHLSILSCVDAVKGALGIRAFWTWTPRQLFRRLQNEQGSTTR